MIRSRTSRHGTGFPLGATLAPGGVNFSVFSKYAMGVQLPFFDRVDAATPTHVIDLHPRHQRSYHYWHAFVPGITAGQHYGYRVDGPFDPEHGHRFDRDKVLIDPYGTCVARCHDGFTLNDLVSYNTKHNEANGHDNLDGASDNLSWNCGVEGPSDDPEVERLRNRQVKNFLALTMLAARTPMLLMGDEVRRMQRGNNNAYYNNDETTWFDWDLVARHADVRRFAKELIALRLTRSLPIDRADMTLREMRQQLVAWHGVKLHEPDWGHDSHTLAATTRLLGNQAQLHMMFNAYWEALAFEIPPAGDGHDGWRRIIDTSLSSPDDARAWADAPTMEAPTYVVQPRSVVLLISTLRDDQRRPESSSLDSSGRQKATTARAPERTTMTSATITGTQLDQLAINTIRTLSMDAVQAAHSGHPGTPMALAPLVYTLWNRVMRFDPHDPIWPGRDRFVLSNGHASMLLWSLLHLTGTRAVNADYERLGESSVTLDDIRHFRQLGSKAPGHPEYRMVSGVETTTGPLGQGIATSVGMAIGERWLADRYNRPGFELFDYHIYAVCGDGCLMEGVGAEAASLAGHLGLDHLCWIFDNNHITIEGSTDVAFTEDVATRFLAYGWNVLRVADANDIERIERAIRVFQRTKGRPTLIILDSLIGYGSPNRQDTAAAHGEPLGDEEIRLTKRVYGWPEDAKFLVPDGVREHFAAGVGKRGADARRAWSELFASYRSTHPDLAVEIDQMQRRQLPVGWDRNLPEFPADPKGLAGRDASGKVLNVLAQNIPWFLGGSADLGPSNKTTLTFAGAGDLQAATPGGRNMHFGVREHAMGSIMNGLSLTKLRPFGATFFIFSDYARPAMRLSALMELPTVFVFTHDALSDGEDGPTHQPVEHLASLRAIPGLVTLRPGDANEVVEAYRYLMPLRHEPAVLVLSRQPLPTIDRSSTPRPRASPAARTSWPTRRAARPM